MLQVDIVVDVGRHLRTEPESGEVFLNAYSVLLDDCVLDNLCLVITIKVTVALPREAIIASILLLLAAQGRHVHLMRQFLSSCLLHLCIGVLVAHLRALYVLRDGRLHEFVYFEVGLLDPLPQHFLDLAVLGLQ